MGRAGMSRESIEDGPQSKHALPANALGYTATHYFSSEASSRVVTDRPGRCDDVFVSNVKIAWAESGAQSLTDTYIR